MADDDGIAVSPTVPAGIKNRSSICRQDWRARRRSDVNTAMTGVETAHVSAVGQGIAPVGATAGNRAAAIGVPAREGDDVACGIFFDRRVPGDD